jgi:serine/threonine-protein kinase HipA
MSGLDLRRLSRAIVYKGDIEAGELERGENEVTFRYRSDYPAAAGAVARTLPVRDTPYVERGGAVPAFFAGLLPEGRRLVAMRSRLKTSPDDEFTQLVAVGGDCVGDVRVMEPGVVADQQEVSVSGMPDSFRDLFSQLLDRPLDDTAVPGVQDKISESMISLPASAKWGPAIVKLTPPTHPRIVENEAFFLDLAAKCGLEVPRHEVVHDKAGESALVVQRFDRTKRAGTITRLPQEDSIQLMGRWPEAKYRVSTREVFHTVAEAASAAPPELLKLTRLFALSYVIGNGDLHGKNVSLYRSGGLWKLTPAYDILSTLPYGDRTMALELEGRNDNIRQRDLIAVASREGLNETAARKAILAVCIACEKALPDLDEIKLDGTRTEDLRRVMTKRISDLRE